MTMKRNNLLFLCLTPLLTPLVIWGINYGRSKQTHNYDVGGFKSAKVGEKVAFSKLSSLLQNGNAQGTVRVAWSVSDLSRSPQSGRIALYSIELKRFDNQLTLLHSPFDNSNAYRFMAKRYKNVSDDAVLSAARSGRLEELMRYGATVDYYGWAKYNQGELLLEEENR